MYTYLFDESSYTYLKGVKIFLIALTFETKNTYNVSFFITAPHWYVASLFR